MASPASHHQSDAADVAATFCATLVDEWVRAGVTDAVISPGSRSTPMTLALLRDARVSVHVHLDERSASFMALGLGLATGLPAVLVCTSGTAATHFHAAVVEAHQARVPMVVVTADRPPELRDVGAPQTIDQTHLYGRSVRFFADPGVPDAASSASWRPLAARAVMEATGPACGPVHLNLPFREPLIGAAGPLPPSRDGARPWISRARRSGVDRDEVAALAELLSGQHGVIVAGAGIADVGAVHALAGRLGWPVLADPRSGCRTPSTATVSHADALLRVEQFVVRNAPAVVLRFGDLPASRVVAEWLGSIEAWQVAVNTSGSMIDPMHRLARVVPAEPGAWCTAALAGLGQRERYDIVEGDWLERWTEADAAAAGVIADVLSRHPEPTEPAIARTVLDAVPPGGQLVVSSSMPVRDLEWYAPARPPLTVFSNRGANGIDGVTSTAVGVALHGTPTVLLTGDLAFLHDTNGLLGLAERHVNLTIVVVDNCGGGIFSFLPQATELPAEQFELAWGTPPRVELAALAGAHGVGVVEAGSIAELAASIDSRLTAGGAAVVRVRTDRTTNVAVHEEIHGAIEAALTSAL